MSAGERQHHAGQEAVACTDTALHFNLERGLEEFLPPGHQNRTRRPERHGYHRCGAGGSQPQGSLTEHFAPADLAAADRSKLFSTDFKQVDALIEGGLERLTRRVEGEFGPILPRRMRDTGIEIRWQTHR